MKSKEKTFVFITLFYIAYMLFPPITALIPVALISVGVVVALLALYPKSLGADYSKWFFVYWVVLFLYCIVGHDFHINGLGVGPNTNLFHKLLIETAWILPNIIICSILIKTKDKNIYKNIGIGVLIIVTASMLAMLPTVAAGGNVIRDNVRLMESGSSANVLLPSYTVLSCYSFLIPIACYGFKHTKHFLKLLFAGLILLVFYMIIKSEITTSFLAAIFVLIFTLVYNKSITQNLLVIFGAISIIIWLLYETGFLLAFVGFLVDLYDGTVAQSKFLDFQAMLMGQGEGDNIEVREICRKLSFDCFVNNPIIGSPCVGEHSSLLDRLGSMGLLGFIPFVMMLITNVFMWTKILPDRGTKIFYLIGIGIIAVFLYFKGLFGGQGYLSLFVILPVTIFGIYLQTQNKTCINNRSL